MEKDIKQKLDKVLTPEQMKTLEQARPPGAARGGGAGGLDRGDEPNAPPVSRQPTN